jgi:hypothetical protein
MKKEIAFTLFMAMPLSASAGIFKCHGSDGQLIFSDKPCPKDAVVVERRLSEDEVWEIERKKARARYEKEQQEERERLVRKEKAAEKERQQRLLEASLKMEEEIKRWTLVPTKSKGPVHNSAWDGSVYQAENYLKRNLKDPDSYEAIEWGRVLTRNNGEEYRVRCKYRAKNSFGGYVIGHHVFALDAEGNVVRMVEYNGKSEIFH